MTLLLLSLVGCPEPPSSSGGPGGEPGMMPGGPGGPGGGPPPGGEAGGGPPGAAPGGTPGGGDPPPFNGEPQFKQDDLTAENSVTVSGKLACEDDGAGPWRLLLFPPPPDDPSTADPSDPPQPFALVVLEQPGEFSLKGPKDQSVVVMSFPDPDGIGSPTAGGMFFANDAKAIDLSEDISDIELDCANTVDGGPPPPGGAGEGPPGAEGAPSAEGGLPAPEGGEMPPPEGGEMLPPPEGGEMPPPPEGGEMPPPAGSEGAAPTEAPPSE